MGGGEPRDGFVTGSAGLSGNALNDEPRVKKKGGGEAADAELIEQTPGAFSNERVRSPFPSPCH